jgi:YD repeat-containing protein
MIGSFAAVVFPDGSTRTSTYQGKLLTSETDQRGQTTRYDYDAKGHLIAVTDSLNQVTRYTYDEVGNQVSQTDSNNRTTRFDYDQMSRRIRTTYPDGTTSSTTHDLAGRRLSETDQDKTVTFSYDLGPPVAVTDALGQVSLTYDAAGQLLTQQSE